jgi:hypothetical protein
MKEGVEHAKCVIVIVTDNGTAGESYFAREMCRQELVWAHNAGKVIVPVVDRDDKARIGALIAEGRKHGFELGSINFCTYDRSGRSQVQASISDIMAAAELPPTPILVDGWTEAQIIKPAAPSGVSSHGASGPRTPLDQPKVEELCAWIVERCSLDAHASATYAEALVGVGVDKPADMQELDEGDWPGVIKTLHLKKLKAAVAAADWEVV